jgi:hypothetical protein
LFFRLPKLALFDAHDRSRGVTGFSINLYFVWIYACF